MRVETFLLALQELPFTTSRELTGDRPFIVLSPHPYDESLGAGGLIAAACNNGERVDVVVLTDGSGSHPRSVLYPRERLVAILAGCRGYRRSPPETMTVAGDRERLASPRAAFKTGR